MRVACILVAIAGMAWQTTARAQGIDMSSGGPVDVTARGGFEWRENEQVVIATGDARAVRQNVTVLADQLLARYRKKAGADATGTPASPAPNSPPPPSTAPVATPAVAQPVPNPAAAAANGEPDTGGNEVYRLEADGHVRIFTPTDQAQGDHGIYDIDQAVLILTGHDLRLTTPQQVITARDSLEYWSQKRMAVGRGNAVVVTSDGRRLQGDVLVGYTSPPATPATAGGAAAPLPVKPATAPGDPLATSGKLERVEAFGNVEVRTATDIVRGDRGVYVPDTGMARIIGHVRITHGQNQLNGPAADINMKTGIAHIVSDPGQRVEGLIMPNDATKATTPNAGGKP